MPAVVYVLTRKTRNIFLDDKKQLWLNFRQPYVFFVVNIQAEVQKKAEYQVLNAKLDAILDQIRILSDKTESINKRVEKLERKISA